jgi:hypothetical protein
MILKLVEKRTLVSKIKFSEVGISLHLKIIKKYGSEFQHFLILFGSEAGAGSEWS